jgi:hypothetical protein
MGYIGNAPYQGVVDTGNIVDNAITSPKISPDTVVAADIAPGAVGTSELANDAVNADKIATGAVGTSELANDAVTQDKIADDAVGLDQLSATGTASSSTYLRGDNAWVAVPAATPGGSTNQVQYNNAGSFAGDSGFVYSGSAVGIGTESPGVKLDVQGSSDTVIRAKGTSGIAGGIFKADGFGSGSYPGFQLAQSGTTYWSIQQRGNTNLHLNRESGSGNVIVDAGNVGIGITNPNAKLVVSGSGNIVRFGDGTSTFDVRFSGPNNWAQQLDTSLDKFNISRNSANFVSITADANLQFNSGYGSVATAYGVRAWVTYNGVDQVIKNSRNISSVTRVATSQFEYNMTTAMPDTTYAVVCAGHNSDAGGGGNFYPNFTSANVVVHFGWSNTTSQFRSRHIWASNTQVNPYHVSLAVIR